jgi:hypothetical protein
MSDERDFVARQFDTDVRPDAAEQSDPNYGSFHEVVEEKPKSKKSTTKKLK